MNDQVAEQEASRAPEEPDYDERKAAVRSALEQIARDRHELDKDPPEVIFKLTRSSAQSYGESRGVKFSDEELWRIVREGASREYHTTDQGNAERLARDHGEDLRFVMASGWYVWDGVHWERDDTGEVRRRAKQTVQDLYIVAGTQTDPKERERLAKHALNSENVSRLRAMIELAESEADVVARLKEFDKNHMLIACPNGTVDLRTGKLRPHLRSDLITKLVPVEYDPEAECPTFIAFLKKVLGDDLDLIDFIQRAVGYSLTGETSEQVLFLLWGSGANGKSTFLETIRSVFGDVAASADFGAFLVHRPDAIRNDLARLVGARMVTAVEAAEGAKLDEATVKQVTGNDAITVRFLHREFFTYTPTYKLWLAANYKPQIRGTDEAIWRRVLLVPFTVTIPKEERDPSLPMKMRRELPGILNWAVRGCLKWLNSGLKPPQAVLEATQFYREEEDILGGFISEKCVEGKKLSVASADLFREYKEWAKAAGEEPISRNSFGRRLSGRGYEAYKNTTTKRMWWEGLELSSNHEGSPVDSGRGMGGI
ncbi:MAG: phage/plasmid primase, P4 family [Planctomycetota bacterium]|nr:phage/plasmid primase, P4 family [Planctomycetota bacterium]